MSWDFIDLKCVIVAYLAPATNYTKNKIKQPASIDPAIYEDYADKYLVGGAVNFEFINENNKFFVLLPFPGPNDKPKKFELTPDSENPETSFFHISDEAGFEFAFPSRKADTFTCSFGPGERIKKELKYENQDEMSSSIESKLPQARLSSTSQVTLAMPRDTKVESTPRMVEKASEERPESEIPVQATEKNSVQEAEETSEDDTRKKPDDAHAKKF